jgi:quercetin dioxygenase-like cupin family protein
MGVIMKENGELVLDQNGCRGTWLFKNAGNEYVHLELEPGGEIPAHALPIPVDFCVLKGTGTAMVNEEVIQVSEGQMIACPPDISRSWKNETPTMVEVLVIKSVG